MNWKWDFFKPQELLSIQGMAQLRKNNLLLHPRAVDKLVFLRKEIDKPIIVNTKAHKNRGYRSVKENKEVGGSFFSRHTQGIAFDCTPVGLELEDFVCYAMRAGWGGIGLYDTFVHVDDRYKIKDKITFWNHETGKAQTIDFKQIYTYTINELKKEIFNKEQK